MFLEIETVDKKEFGVAEVDFIGRGEFANVYKTLAGMVISLVNPKEKSRQYISKLRIAHVPNIAYLGEAIVFGRLVDVYVSELYDTEYETNELAQVLHLYNEFYDNRPICSDIRTYNRMLVRYFNSWCNISSVVEAINTIYCILPENYVLEFTRNNLAVDRDGRLILLDVAFVLDK